MDIRYFYNIAKDRMKYGCDLNDFHDLKTGKFLKSANQKMRLNLVMSSVNAKTTYGGGATIYTFFQQLKDRLNCDVRVITLDDSAQESNIGGVFADFRIAAPSEETEYASTLVGYPENNGERPCLMIREKDVFITTYWTTMYVAGYFRAFQDRAYGQHQNLIYFIQDYEPGFYEWGSEYLLAESTYRIPDTVAVFNSEELKNYFDKYDYQFADRFWFTPKLNRPMKEYLLQAMDSQEKPERKPQVIIYGRPRIWRNCFSLVVASLKQALEYEEKLRGWQFLSLGASHKDIDLGYGAKLVCKGKLTLEEYARTLLETKIGISLMCSPHPSYPPLEMAAFGVNTITNSFLCKDLSTFSKNIISVDNATPENFASALVTGMNRKTDLMDRDDPYLQDEDQFSEIIDDLIRKLKKENAGETGC